MFEFENNSINWANNIIYYVLKGSLKAAQETKIHENIRWHYNKDKSVHSQGLQCHTICAVDKIAATVGVLGQYGLTITLVGWLSLSSRMSSRFQTGYSCFVENHAFELCQWTDRNGFNSSWL